MRSARAYRGTRSARRGLGALATRLGSGALVAWLALGLLVACGEVAPAPASRADAAIAGDEVPRDDAASGADGALQADAASSADGAPRALFEVVDAGLPSMPCGRPGSPTILEVNGGGVALFDADGDRDLDVLLVAPGAYPARGAATGGTNRLYRNDGGALVDVTAGSGVDVPGFCNGVAIADVDADGDRDVYLTRFGPNLLLRNLGGLRFAPVEDALGAAGDAWSTSAAFFDADRDGDLDLYVANYLAFDPDAPPRDGVDGRTCRWKDMPVMCGPQGLPPQADRVYLMEDGRFVDRTEALGFAVPPAYGLGVIDGDFDGDGRTDVYVSNDSVPNFLFLAQQDGRFLEHGLLSGTALSARGREQAGMGLAAGDLDGDLLDEIMVTNFSGEPNAVYRNLGGGLFADEGDPMGLGGPSRALLGWGVAFVDVDLDADLDVLCANGHVYAQADAPGTDTSWAQPARLWLNDGRARFAPAAWPADEPARGRALAVGDLDGDLVTDVVITRLGEAPLVLRGLARGAALQVDLDGPPGNPDGYGAAVTLIDADGPRGVRVRASGGYQAVSDPRPVFAFGGPARLVVAWPDGRLHERDARAPGRITIRWNDDEGVAHTFVPAPGGRTAPADADSPSPSGHDEPARADDARPAPVAGDAPVPAGDSMAALRGAAADPEVAAPAPLDDPVILEAARALSAGRPQAVHELLAPYLAQDPPHPDVQIIAGSAAYELGRYEECVDRLTDAVRRVPGFVATSSYLAFAHYKLGAFDDARAAFEAILAADPDSVKAHYGLGLVALGQGRDDDARAALEESLALDPGYLRAWYAKARLHEGRGELAEALEAVERVTRGWPSHEEALYLHGRVLARLGLDEEAARVMERRALVYATREAVGGIVARLRAGERDPQLHAAIVQAWLAIGARDEARDALAAGLAAHPGDARLLALRARVDED